MRLNGSAPSLEVLEKRTSDLEKLCLSITHKVGVKPLANAFPGLAQYNVV